MAGSTHPAAIYAAIESLSRPIVGHTPRKLPRLASNLPHHRTARPYRRSIIVQHIKGESQGKFHGIFQVFQRFPRLQPLVSVGFDEHNFNSFSIRPLDGSPVWAHNQDKRFSLIHITKRSVPMEPVAIRDFLSFQFVSSPTWSPDGASCAFWSSRRQRRITAIPETYTYMRPAAAPSAGLPLRETPRATAEPPGTLLFPASGKATRPPSSGVNSARFTMRSTPAGERRSRPSPCLWPPPP